MGTILIRLIQLLKDSANGRLFTRRAMLFSVTGWITALVWTWSLFVFSVMDRFLWRSLAKRAKN